MSRYTGIRFVLISPEELKLPRYVKEQYIKSRNIPYIQSTSLDEVMPELDILYMTRVQRERFFNEEDYLRLKDSYILTPEKLKNAKPDLRDPASPAPCQRDLRGGGRRSPRLLLPAGAVRQVHPHGADSEAAGHRVTGRALP